MRGGGLDVLLVYWEKGGTWHVFLVSPELKRERKKEGTTVLFFCLLYVESVYDEWVMGEMERWKERAVRGDGS